MNTQELNAINYFKFYFLQGLKYALYFMVVAGVMGLIYGAFGGIFISPIFVAISYVGIYVFLNFLIALLLGILNLFASIFKKGSQRLARYFAYSLAFLVVFMTYFAAYKFLGLEVL